MRRLFLIISLLCLLAVPSAMGQTSGAGLDRAEMFLTDSLDSGRAEILAQLENMPNIEVGKGVTFRPKNDSYEMTIRFRMQNMVGLSFGEKFNLTGTEAQVKRLRLRFDGYIFSPKFLYSIQLGFTGYDAKTTPNGTVNIVRDAIVYYKPSPSWNLGFGQTKLKTNRARINSSSALQFVDRSIVNSEFGGDRDFGFFGEYYYGGQDSFALSVLASVTLGEGRNWGKSSVNGLAYTGRMELYPFGRFHAKGEYMEGDTYHEDKVKLMLGGGYSFNQNARMTQGFKGKVLPGDISKNIGTWYADLILKYRGFSFNADYMGRHAGGADFGTYVPSEGGDGQDWFIYTGHGINAQTSYLFDRKWEVALRNSTMLPNAELRSVAGYKMWNQSTLGVTRYIIGHSLKVQLDVSYNYMSEAVKTDYDRWGIRLQLELGL